MKSWLILVLSAGLAAAEPSVVPPVAAGVAQKAARQIALRFPSGKKILVDVADTPESREVGLMFRKKLPKNYGMLFVFPHEQGLEFWMKNTWASLDIIYIGVDKKITRVHGRVKASTEKTTDAEVARVGGRGQYVLELPAGTAERLKLKEGQSLRFEVRIPEK